MHYSFPFKKNQQLDYITDLYKEEHFAHSKSCIETFKKLNICSSQKIYLPYSKKVF
ncbi:hypothetical protein RV02_GL001798 [Enterococcus gilvus]|nr:hypothetical protein RV02_GL001798 [Enterococcus gilvus]